MKLNDKKKATFILHASAIEIEKPEFHIKNDSCPSCVSLAELVCDGPRMEIFLQSIANFGLPK